MDIVDYSVVRGRADKNGVDFWWDEEEGNDCVEEQSGCVDTDTQFGNCWYDNAGLRRAPLRATRRDLLCRPARDSTVPAGELGEAGGPRAMRNVEPGRQSGPARAATGSRRRQSHRNPRP